MRINPERLLVLGAVAEAGGITAAGRLLHLAPSGVSQHIAALERETGLILLDRSRRGGQRPVALTAAGRRLVTHAHRLAQVLAEAEAEVHTLSGRVDGPVTLAAFPTAIHRLVAPALVSLAITHPGVRPSVREIDEQFMLAALQTGDLDLALVEDDALRPTPSTPGLTYQGLLDDAFRVAVPTGWPAALTFADLAESPWVDGPPDSAVARTLQRLRATSGLPLRGEHSCLEFPAALSLVAAGLAAALVPALALHQGKPAGVRPIDVAGLGARRISVVHRAGPGLPGPAVRVLLDSLLAAAQSDG